MRLTLALIAVITASSAAAAPGPAKAELAAPARVAAVVAGTGMWRCDGSTCTGSASSALRQAVIACADVAGAAGRVAAFSVAGYTFTDDDLARCNRHVKS